MANVHAAIKQIRKDSRKRVRNQAAISELKNFWHELALLPKGEKEKAGTLAQTLISKWDRAVSRGIVPKARANRKKARIASHLNRLSR